MDESWVRLGRRIQVERGRQGFANAADLAAAADVGRRTVEIIESATHTGFPRPTTLAKIETALGWEEGSVDRVREGGEPRLVDDPVLARLLAAWPRLTHDQKIAVAQLVQAFLRQR